MAILLSEAAESAARWVIIRQNGGIFKANDPAVFAVFGVVVDADN
jgi:hypothetical protein